MTAKALEEGSKMSFTNALIMEYNLCRHFFEHVADLQEGILAKLIEKTHMPKWSTKIDDVTIKKLFSDYPCRLDFHNDRDYSDYPLRFGLPSVEDIHKLVIDNKSLQKEQLIDKIVMKREPKMGLREKLASVVERHVETRPDGTLLWQHRKNKQNY